MVRAAVLGSGSWGTALAIHLAKNGVEVTLWGRDADEMADISARNENRAYLPGIQIPEQVIATATMPADADYWIVAVPSAAVDQVVNEIPPSDCSIIVASKGLERDSGKRMSEVAIEAKPNAKICVLSGPNLAVELANGVPTATDIASTNIAWANAAASVFTSRCLRVFTNTDLIGVELGGALKNVYAIGAGMSDGLGFGDNTKGAFLSRGLVEMSNFGESLGGAHKTFLGLSGVGDLFATAASPLSRNYRVGNMVGRGYQLDDALNEIGQVAEGVPTCEAALKLARRHGVNVPIIEALQSVLAGKLKPIDGVSLLMATKG